MASVLEKQMAAAKSAKYVVEIEDKVLTPRITRRGRDIPAVLARDNEKEALLDRLGRSDPKAQPRCVGQSIKAGQRVTPGTEIDIVLVDRRDVPIKIYDGVHIGMAEFSTDKVLSEYLNDDALLEAVLKYESVDKLPARERRLFDAKVEEGAARDQFEVDDSDPAKSREAVYQGLRGSAAFL